MHPYFLLALVALPHTLDLPRFSPEAPVALRRTFEWSTQLSFVEMSSLMGGQPVPQEYLPDLEIEAAETRRLVVLDELAGVEDGRPTRLVRTFEEIAAKVDEEVSMNGEDAGSREAEGESLFEGARIAFEWNAEEQEFEAGWLEDEADDLSLDGLREDLDLRAFLPPAGTKETGAWDIDASAIQHLMEPGGDLAITGVEEPGGAFTERSFDADVRARLGETREEGGRTLIVIELEGEGEQVSDRPTDLSMIPVADGDATDTRHLSFELEGRITWDPAAGRAVACELDLDLAVEQRLAKDPGQDGPDFEATTVMSGSSKLRASIAPAD